MTLKGKEYVKKFSCQKKWSGHGRTGRTTDYSPDIVLFRVTTNSSKQISSRYPAVFQET